MFSPRAGVSRVKSSPFTPSRGAKSSSSRRSVSLFTPGRRPQLGSARSSGRPNRSLHTSQIIEETTQHIVESYGSSLPILVTEALTLSDSTVRVSVKIDPNGWAWLVCGRRLLVWKYKPSIFGKTGQCKELTLPPSNLEHKADLVTVYGGAGDGHLVSCVASSPEGVVRYWSSISHEGALTETSVDLKGDDEAVSLVSIQPYGFVLATSTSQLTLIELGQGQITYQHLKNPQGMLSGIGRRMSSFIFGAIPADVVGSKLHKVLVGEELGAGGQALYSLTGGQLQKWQIGEGERILYQCEAERLTRDMVAETIWGKEAGHLAQLKVWLLDMEMTKDGVAILTAAVNEEISPEMFYAIGTLSTEELEAPHSFLSFSVSKFTQSYQEDDEDELLGYRLLIPDANSGQAFMFDDCRVVFMSVIGQSQGADKKEFTGPGERILGAGKCDGTALLFSNNHGLVSVTANSIIPDISIRMDESSLQDYSFQTGRPESSLAMTPVEAIQELSMSEGTQSRLKAAFLHVLRKNRGQAQCIIDELFAHGQASSEVDSTLDSTVTGLSAELIDDYPTSDPRWAEAVPQYPTSSSASLILLHQLEDKEKAHDYYIGFLKDLNLWDRLSSVTVRDVPLAARMLLCEHAEKIQAAISLTDLHRQNQQLVDTAIEMVLEQRGSEVHSGLTHQDVFYREVSKIDELLEALVVHEEAALSGDITPKEMIILIAGVNTVLEGMLRDACKYRLSKQQVFRGVMEGTRDPEYIPWTSSVGPRGIRNILFKQHGITFNKALPEVQDTTTQGILFQQLVSITDIILDGFKAQLDSLRRMPGNTERYQELVKEYEKARDTLIEPFVEESQYERAATLAEKYCHYSSLVRICEETNNQDRLQRYMQKYQGFSDYVFKWYMDKGKRGKLLSQPLQHNAELARFLQAEGNQFLSWLHDINTGNFMQAHLGLKALSSTELKYMAKKKTLLSLSKLAALATDGDDVALMSNIEEIDVEQSLILHQETLPEDVLDAVGMDPDDMRVLSPVEMIELYVSDYNRNANQFDFKKALDLLQFVDKNDPDIDIEELRLHIWSRSVLKDSWPDLDTDSPQEAMSSTVFFKVVELAFNEGADVLDFMPDVNKLLQSDELESYRDSKNFQYLIRAGYEHLHSMFD